MADLTVVREIAPGAQVHADARVGRWCVIGPDARIGAGTRLDDRVTIVGRTTLGRDNTVASGSVIGGWPQDLKYRGGTTRLIIGDRNRIGRNVTIHLGTETGGWVTCVGNDNTLCDMCHVAHDCYVADRAYVGWAVLLAGHIVLETGSRVEDMTGIHHFTRVGRFARVGPRTPVRRDVPPFTDFYSEDYYWDPPMVRGLHEAGLAAAGLADGAEARLRLALQLLFEDETAMTTKLDQLEAAGVDDEPELAHLCRFCRQSLSGLYGRYREMFRGQIPPEAEQYLPADVLAEIRKEASCQ